MNRLDLKEKQRIRRKLRIRKKIKGTAEKPRMTIYKSNKYIYLQVIDDTKGLTLVSASNIEKELRNLKSVVADAEKLGQAFGERLLSKNIDTVVFDRNGYLYHGVVKAVADGARKAGIKF
jgi:large subunit ribosomal protein L18